MKRTGPAAAAVTAAVGLLATGCSSAPNDVPYSWISDTYSYSMGNYVDRSDPPSKVADEIDGHTKAADRIFDDGMVFLRYEDDIVAISPRTDSASGSVIDVDDYEDGYDRWRSHVRTWPAPGSSSFRGGGHGFGK